MQQVKKGVLIKLMKVKQDLRADLPTIGLQTLKNCLKSGVVGIAYSANKTIFLDKEKVLSFCRKNDLRNCYGYSVKKKDFSNSIKKFIFFLAIAIENCRTASKFPGIVPQTP